ncbi:Gfo/Idh/MocA family protein [Nonomuraea basaltis]|uniref:Gfo/Idh/MocA family protein n=1 Tax=Nonomuraea basaltis TaxID=2495887 RepID=UPI00110C5A85|nr:Gfo/Idh/MocA family oxidoreductase [Nonomuraea basaltis]TMR96563.1 Gfo/Idh/MocA family oxidoreductase [Nonomuraea basaltis]
MTRVALVGLGDIGMTAHLPALTRHPEVTIACLVDPSPDRRKVAGDAFRTEASVDDAIAAHKIDAFVLATPPWVTSDLAARLLAEDWFVLAEKPITNAGAFQNLTTAQRRRLQVGLTYRHDPALARLREWIKGGRLGARLLVRAHIYDEVRRPADKAHARRIEATLAHGAPVIHEGSHLFDWLAFLIGGVPDICDAWSMPTRDGLAAANLIGARLRYPDGTQVLAEFGWLTEALPPCEITVLGDLGTATLRLDTFELELRDAKGTENVSFPVDRVTRCFDLQLSRFVDLVRGRELHPHPDLNDGLQAMRVSEAVFRRAAA